MKKTIATLSIILILLNIFIPYSNTVYASGITQKSVDRYMNEGEGSLPTNGGGSGDIKLDATGNNQSSLITALLEILIVPPMIGNWLLSIVATGGQSTYTIQDMLLNKYALFDIDFFKVEDTEEDDNSNSGEDNVADDTSDEGEDGEDPNKKLTNILKENVAIWYFTLRNISMIGSALIIIYVAIRIILELARRRKRTRSYGKI